MQGKTYTYGQIWRIAFPILVSVLMEQLIGMTDAAFLGRVGEVELGACAIGGVFYIAIFMLGMGFCVGAQILMGRRNGEGAYNRIGSIFYHGIAFLLLMSAVLFFATRAWGPYVLEHIVSSPAVCKAAEDYLDWRVYGFFFAFVASMFRSFYVATTNTRTLTLNSLAMVACNIVFNYILIYGKCGLPAFGIAGAAMGSSLSEAVSMVFFICYTRFRMDYRRYGFNVLPRPRLSILGHVLGISVWTMVQNFVSLSTWFLFMLAVEHLGERQLAVTNIIRNISSFTFMTVIALASTASTLASNLMGQGEADAVRPMLQRTVRLGFFILVPVWALMFIFPDLVMRIFTNEEALITAGRAPLYVLGTSYVLTIPAQIYFHAVSGTGNTRTALLFELISLTVYTLYVWVVVFRMRASLSICWTSEHVYGVMAFFFSWAYIRWGNWRLKRI